MFVDRIKVFDCCLSGVKLVESKVTYEDDEVNGYGDASLGGGTQ